MFFIIMHDSCENDNDVEYMQLLFLLNDLSAEILVRKHLYKHLLHSYSRWIFKHIWLYHVCQPGYQGQFCYFISHFNHWSIWYLLILSAIINRERHIKSNITWYTPGVRRRQCPKGIHLDSPIWNWYCFFCYVLSKLLFETSSNWWIGNRKE